MKTTTTAMTVSRAIGFLQHARNPDKLFAMETASGGEELFTVLSIKGTKGRPQKGNALKGFGCQTTVVVKTVSMVKGGRNRTKVMKVATIINRAVEYLGKTEYVLAAG